MQTPQLATTKLSLQFYTAMLHHITEGKIKKHILLLASSVLSLSYPGLCLADYNENSIPPQNEIFNLGEIVITGNSDDSPITINNMTSTENIRY